MKGLGHCGREKTTHFSSVRPFLDQSTVNTIAFSKEKGSNTIEATHDEDDKRKVE